MAVLKDFKCDKHGYFESRKAQCPMKDCQAEVHVQSFYKHLVT
jgi:hypothetical protein